MTAWQDDDGSAYLARSVQNAYLGVSKLDSSFGGTRGVCASTNQVRIPVQASEKRHLKIVDPLDLQ